MFGTLVEVEGGSERRWGQIAGARLGRTPLQKTFHMGRVLRGFGASFADEDPTMVFDDNGNVTYRADPVASGPSTFDTITDLLKTVAPSLLGVVTAAINRGAQPSAGNACPPGYNYYSPIVHRCFQTPGEMSNAEQLFMQAGGTPANGGGFGGNTALLVGAGVLGVVALALFLKK